MNDLSLIWDFNKFRESKLFRSLICTSEIIRLHHHRLTHPITIYKVFHFRNWIVTQNSIRIVWGNYMIIWPNLLSIWFRISLSKYIMVILVTISIIMWLLSAGTSILYYLSAVVVCVSVYCLCSAEVSVKVLILLHILILQK